MTGARKAKKKSQELAGQNVLPFDFWEEEKQQERERLEKIMAALPGYEHPETDKEILLELQRRYRHGDDKALAALYKVAEQVCMRFVNAIGHKNRHVRELTWSEKKIKAEDAATYLIEQYITRPDFVTTNAPGYLYLRVEFELFYQREVDKIVDFVDFAAFFKEGTEDDMEVEA